MVGETEYFGWVLLAAGLAGILSGLAVFCFATDGSSPTWRMARCFAGFLCSMVWIAAIADQVVDVLQVGRPLGFTK